ncbi:pseudouridine synthase [Oceanobacillus oncorhynchi subsp. incaldanensis]|uniref:Pseudouridine synthase n=1 Tax=Oceanobacillus aidingensis TaxID=645964 RepID=A0ABV9JYH0_9BACI|nr:RluA family pseudouridine synthase [Oceanobacillus oncorhynchi]GIO20816.1 pseudouridine synthase [Oceanobacillus oncorhynchi subsp. incaldanensis]
MTAAIQKSWVIPEDSAQLTIKEFLQKKQGFSRRLLTAMKQEGGKFLINEKKSYITEALRKNDTLTVIFPDEVSGGIEATEMNLAIIYEDEDHLVLNKPAGQACLPAMNDRRDSLANGIQAYYNASDHPATVHIVTRLDRDTSGLVLVAKNRYAHALLSKAQKKNQIHRTYEAIITGEMTPSAGTVHAPIARKKTSIIEREVNWEDGKEATTHYQTVSKLSGASLLRIQLETGRTHQIRVHFSHLGHPLLGDDLYGGSTDALERQALHCTAIEWENPFEHKKMQFHCMLSSDMAACKKSLSMDYPGNL